MTLLTSLRVRLRAREAVTNVARRRRERLAAATWSPDAERRFKEACDLRTQPASASASREPRSTGHTRPADEPRKGETGAGNTLRSWSNTGGS